MAGLVITPTLNTINMVNGTASLDVAAGVTVDINADLKTGYATVASHATTSAIWAAAGNVINFTGTETLTDLPAAPQAGAQRTLICAGAVVFTHAGSLTVQGAATYTAAAGDVIIVTATSTTTFKINVLNQASKPAILLAGTAGKTITVTQNTSLDEAVAMSSKLTLALGAADLKAFMNAAGTAAEFANGIKLGTFNYNIATASGTQAIAGVGFKPSHVVFLGVCNGKLSISIDNGTVAYCAYTTATSAGWGSTDIGLLFPTGDGTYYAKGKISTLGADGFTLTWTKVNSPTGTAEITYLALR